MGSGTPRLPHARGRTLVLLAVGACFLLPRTPAAQGLTGVLIGTVRDAQGGAVTGATVSVTSPALIGGPATLTTNDRGQLRFPALPPGWYVLEVDMPGFATLREPGILIAAGATIERTAVLTVAGLAVSVAVEGAGAHLDARNPGCRDPIRTRGSARHSDAAIEHVRHDQGRPRDLAHLAVERHGHHGVGVRIGHQREPVPVRRHELHLPVQRGCTSGTWHRLHPGSARPVRRRLGRVRQHAGRRDQRDHPARAASSCGSRRPPMRSSPASPVIPWSSPIWVRTRR